LLLVTVRVLPLAASRRVQGTAKKVLPIVLQ
jgi:hypothetical protein